MLVLSWLGLISSVGLFLVFIVVFVWTLRLPRGDGDDPRPLMPRVLSPQEISLDAGRAFPGGQARYLRGWFLVDTGVITGRGAAWEDVVYSGDCAFHFRPGAYVPLEGERATVLCFVASSVAYRYCRPAPAELLALA